MRGLGRLFLVLAWSYGQGSFTLSGYVRDVSNREALSGAKVFIIERQAGVLSNAYGYYAIKLPAGRYTAVAQFVGYKAETLQVNLNRDIRHDFFLSEEGVTLKEVQIVETYEQRRFESAAMSQNRIDVQQLRKLPAFFGEVDVLRSLSFLPGVTTAGDGSGSFFVRGGSFDQNLVLLDEAVVYNPGHIGGIFSAFNADALQEARLYKGYMPPEYGGRLSSVLDVRLREGTSPKWRASGGVGLISSRLSLEGPLLRDRMGLLLTARRTYADLFLLFAKDPALRSTKLYFYDFTAKLNYNLSDKHRIYLSGYFGRDVFRSAELVDLNWGNATTTFRWNWIASPRLFVNTFLSYAKYDYAFGVEQGNNQARYSAGIEDISWRSDFDYFLSERVKLRWGGGLVHHTFLPGRLDPTSESSNVRPYRVPSLRGMEASLYLQASAKLSARWLLEGGLRWAGFALLGPATLYTFEQQQPRDTLFFPANQIAQAYGGLEPRLSVRYALSDLWALKGAFARVRQFLHVATYSPVGLPTDIWWPSTRNILPQDGYQYALALQSTPRWKGHQWDLSWEVFYRQMYHILDFRSGADLILNPQIEQDLVQGRGWAYGAEWMLQKLTGRLTGWISYTYSRTFRYIPEITPNPFPSYVDRPHSATLVLQYALSPRWEVALTGIYATGRPITVPVAKYVYDGQVLGVYNERNSRRMPDYHRLDFSITWTAPKKEGRRWTSSWNFAVYNLYGRRNMWALRLRQDPDDPSRQRAYNLYLFRWVPAITYNFSFQ